ncbi:MAG: PilZ domain-containing protein [Myxococcota bacterium]
MTNSPEDKPKEGGSERRQVSRVPLDAQVTVTVTDTDALFRSRVRDLSERGVFILAQHTRPIGTSVRVSMILQLENVVLEVRGLIVHEVPADAATEERPAGMGVMFTEVPDESQALLRYLVQKANERSSSP